MNRFVALALLLGTSVYAASAECVRGPDGTCQGADDPYDAEGLLQVRVNTKTEEGEKGPEPGALIDGKEGESDEWYNGYVPEHIRRIMATCSPSQVKELCTCSKKYKHCQNILDSSQSCTALDIHYCLEYLKKCSTMETWADCRQFCKKWGDAQSCSTSSSYFPGALIDNSSSSLVQSLDESMTMKKTC